MHLEGLRRRGGAGSPSQSAEARTARKRSRGTHRQRGAVRARCCEGEAERVACGAVVGAQLEVGGGPHLEREGVEDVEEHFV